MTEDRRDMTVRKLERELQRNETDPKDVGAQLLGTERGRYSILCTLPVPGAPSTPVYVTIDRPDAPRTQMHQHPLDRIEDLLAVLAYGQQQRDVHGFDPDLIATIHDAKEGKAIGDLVLTFRRPFGGVRVWQRDPVTEAPVTAPHEWVQATLEGGLAACRVCGIRDDDFEEKDRPCPGPPSHPASGIPFPTTVCRWCGAPWVAWADSSFMTGAAPRTCRDCAHAHRHLNPPHSWAYPEDYDHAAGAMVECAWCGATQGGPKAALSCPTPEHKCLACWRHGVRYEGMREVPPHDCTGRLDNPCMCTCNDES